MYKRVIILAALGIIFTFHSYAAEQIQRITAYLNNEIHVIANGKFTELENPVVIVDGRSYLPVREIGELLDAEVEWDERTKTIIVANKDEEDEEDYKRDDEDKEKKDKDEEEHVDVAGNIKLHGLMHYKVNYRGTEYSLLAAYYRNSTYFRVSDVQKMGIRLANFLIYRDEFTKQLFVHEDALKAHLNINQMNYAYEPILENEVSRDTLDFILEEMQYVDYGEYVNHFVVYTVEQTGENQFKLLCQETRGQYAYVEIKIKKNELREWYISSFGVEYLNDLEDLYEDDEDYYY